MFLKTQTFKNLLSRPFFHFSALYSNPNYHFLTDKPKDHHDLIFIRHAESMFNQACEDYRKANNIPYVWKSLVNHEGF